MSSPNPQTDHQHTTDPNACPVINAINTIGSEWRLTILHDLTDTNEKRFNELKRSTNASSRTLSRVLDDLEEANLINRRVEQKPIATYYSLTDRAKALCPVFNELQHWANNWL